MSGLAPGRGRPTMLVVELEGAPQIAAAAESLGWNALFADTQRYADWLPTPDRAWAAANTDRIVAAPDPSFHALFELAEAQRARSVLPISLLEPECARDALLLDHAARVDPTMRVVANAPSVVELTYDKWLTKSTLAAADLPVVPGRAVSDGPGLLAAVEEFGLPVIIKPRRDFTGRGLRLLTTHAEVDAAAKRAGRNTRSTLDLLVEPFTAGAEVSVEIIRGGGTCLVQPPAYKGETRLNALEHPIYRPRIAPWAPGPVVSRRIASLAVTIATELRLHGAAELEFIVIDGEPYLMEVNPRVSGVTRLAMAAGGHDTFAMLTRLAAGASLAGIPAPARAVALGLPITVPTTDPRVLAAARAPSVRYVKPITWMPLLPIRGSILLAADTPEALTREIERLAPLTNEAYLAEAYAALDAARATEHAPQISRRVIVGNRAAVNEHAPVRDGALVAASYQPSARMAEVLA